MRLPVLLILLFVSTTASAQLISKAQLASRFYDATTAKFVSETVNDATAAIVRGDPKKAKQSDIYRKWALETFTSKEYKEIYIQYFVENYSREELTAMNTWAKDPLFVSYIHKTQKFNQWSGPRLQKLLESRNEELVRRLRAAGFDTTK